MIDLQTRECRARVHACNTDFGGVPLVTDTEDTQAVVMDVGREVVGKEQAQVDSRLYWEVLGRLEG